MTEALSEPRRLAAEALLLAATAFELVRSPARWVKEEWAVDGRGRIVSVYDARASRFCLVGAVLRGESDRFGTVTDYQASFSADRPTVVPGEPRLRLLLDLLGCRAIHALRERGFVIDLSLAGEGEPASEKESSETETTHVFLHDLPAMYNGVKGVKYQHALTLLLEAAGLLRQPSLLEGLGSCSIDRDGA